MVRYTFMYKFQNKKTNVWIHIGHNLVLWLVTILYMYITLYRSLVTNDLFTSKYILDFLGIKLFIPQTREMLQKLNIIHQLWIRHLKGVYIIVLSKKIVLFLFSDVKAFIKKKKQICHLPVSNFQNFHKIFLLLAFLCVSRFKGLLLYYFSFNKNCFITRI